MNDTLRRTRCFLATAALALLTACGATHEKRVSPARALAAFREASPAVDALAERGVAVAVFVHVEDTAEGCVHAGELVHASGATEPVVLRCLEEPRAPGGYSYHQLVVLRDAHQLDTLRTAGLDFDGFARLAPHDLDELDGHDDAPGWIVSTHRPQLLFGDQTVRQRMETTR